MAEDASDGIIWLLQIPESHTEFLAGIRHWEGLQLARAEGAAWIGGLTTAQVKMPAVGSLPHKNIWQQREGFLFKPDTLVPQMRVPELQWKDLKMALPLDLPKQNFNFFGVRERLPMQLVRSVEEAPVAALLLPLETLHSYMQTAPAVRLEGLTWTVLGNENALVLGTPILPLPGTALWRAGNLLLPAGWDFQWPALTDAIVSKHDLVVPDTLSVWVPGGNRLWVKENQFQRLTIGSFRLTLRQIYDQLTAPS